MRKLVLAVGVLVLLGITVILAAPFLIPVESYRGLIEAQVQKATGREFRIAGAMRLSLLPRVRIELNDVRLGNVAGAKAPAMATMRRLDVGVSLGPLLHRRIEAERLVLIGPAIALEVDRNGKPNWQFATTRAEQPAPPPASPAGSSITFQFSGLTIQDGSLSYLDQRTGAQQVFDKLDLRVDASAPDSPITMKGGVNYRGQRIGLSVHADRLAALMQSSTTPLRLKLNAGPAKLEFTGSYTGVASKAVGQMKAEIGAVGALIGWIIPDKAGRPFPVESVSLSAQVAADPRRASLHDLVFKADTMEARGDLSADWTGARPKLAGNLATGLVDLSPYLSAQKDKPAKAAPAAGENWSDQPLDLHALGTADADLRLQAAGIKGRGFTTGATSAVVALHDGRLDVTIPSTTLFGGTADARLHVVAGAAPNFGLETRIRGVQAEPLLTAFVDFNRLQGTMHGTISLRAQGASQRAIVGNLNGTVATTFVDGAIKGINIASVLRRARTAYLDPAAGSAEKTDFAELSSSFVVRNGTAHTDDLKMIAPLMRLKGEGDVVIPERRLAMRLEPTLVGTLKGQGGDAGLGGIAVPVLVSGPWNHPSFTPDVQGIATKALKDRLLGSGAGGGLKGALGGLGSKPADSGAKPSGALGRLRGLFGH